MTSIRGKVSDDDSDWFMSWTEVPIFFDSDNEFESSCTLLVHDDETKGLRNATVNERENEFVRKWWKIHNI